MIPQKLQIKNFLSYGPIPQTIDFSHYSLICLSGKKDHGKSANTNTFVFDFIFGGKTYKIRREYMEIYGKPITILD